MNYLFKAVGHVPFKGWTITKARCLTLFFEFSNICDNMWDDFEIRILLDKKRSKFFEGYHDKSVLVR